MYLRAAVESAHKTFELEQLHNCSIRCTEHSIKHQLHCKMRAILMSTSKSASLFFVRETHFFAVSLKPSSDELYSGQIAPEMSIGVFLTSHGNGLRAHFRTFYAI